MSIQSDATTGYLFIQKDMSKHVAGLAAFVGGGATWAGSAHHYLLAIVVGAGAGLLLILAICAEAETKRTYKHVTLAIAIVLSMAIGFKANEYANEPNHPVVTVAPPTTPSVVNNNANSTKDYDPAIAGSPGATVTYNISPPPETSPKKNKK